MTKYIGTMEKRDTREVGGGPHGFEIINETKPSLIGLYIPRHFITHGLSFPFCTHILI